MRPIDADALLERENKCFLATQNILAGYEVRLLIHTTLQKLLKDAPTIEQPTWISCAERLPSYGERVLAAVCGNVEPLTLYYRDLLVEDYWEDDVERVIRLGAVTHWMPLPQPPKGG